MFLQSHTSFGARILFSIRVIPGSFIQKKFAIKHATWIDYELLTILV